MRSFGLIWNLKTYIVLLRTIHIDLGKGLRLLFSYLLMGDRLFLYTSNSSGSFLVAFFRHRSMDIWAYGNFAAGFDRGRVYVASLGID